LKWISDRLQVKVNSIIINLDIDIRSDGSRNLKQSAKDMLTVQLSIENIDIQGVTSSNSLEVSMASPHPSISPNGFQGTENLSLDGKRRISLSNIRTTLISDATLFEGLARISG